jgi:hypothetical protein
MSNIKKLAKSLAKNVNQLGYVTLDQAAFEKIKSALDLAVRLAEETDDSELLAVAKAGVEAAQDLVNPMPLGHAYDTLSRMMGLKDFNSLSAMLTGAEPSTESREQTTELDGSVDYRMAEGDEFTRLWIEVGAFSVYVNRTHEGVIVDLFATGCEDENSLGSLALEWVDAEEVMRRAGRGWLIYSPGEAAATDGDGFWSNHTGWVADDEATVFTNAEKERMALPASTGNDARWVSLGECHVAAEKTPCVQCGLQTQVDDYGFCNRCHDLNELPVQILDNEQPTVCPKCGSRTEFDELTDGRQHHTCLACSYEFLGEFDKDSSDTD